MKTKSIFSLAVGLLFVTTNLQAQTDSLTSSVYEMSLEDLMNIQVSTASKRAEKLTETPNVMHLITEQQIKTRGYRNLRDVLSDIPGFNVLHNGLVYASQVRGIAPNDNEKVSLMINGVMISYLTEDNYLNNLINLDNVSKIEVIIGPGSVMYGSKSLCSIINIITKESDNTEISLGAGNYNHKAATVSSGKKFDDAHFFVSGTRVQSDGFDAFKNVPTSAGFDKVKGSRLTGMLNPSYFLFGNGSYKNWSLQFSSINSSMPEMYISKSGGNVKGNRDEEHDNMTVKNHQQWTDNFSGDFMGSYSNKRMLRAVTQNDTVKGVQTSFDLSQKEYDADYSIKHEVSKNIFQAGAQFCYFQNRHNYMYTWFPNNPSNPGSSINSIVEIKDTYSYGVYMSDNFKPTEKLSLTGAFRLDQSTILNDKKVFFNPRVAIVYTPNDLFTTKLMYNTATRMPSPWMSPMNELWNYNKYDNITQKYNDVTKTGWLMNTMSEKAERLTAYEWQNIIKSGSSMLSANMYYQQLDNFIGWFSPFTNAGNFSGYGAELNGMTGVTSFLNVWANASYNKAKFDNTARANTTYGVSKSVANDKGEMMSVPLITANVGTDFHFKDIYFSPRIKYSYHTPAFEAATSSFYYLENRIDLNATISWTNILRKNLTLQLVGKNLTNNTATLPMQFQALTYTPQGINFEVVGRYAF